MGKEKEETSQKKEGKTPGERKGQKNLIRSARNAVSAFQERGAEALRKMVFAMKIPNALCLMKNVLHSGMEGMNRKAAKIAIIGGELGKAKGHLKNVVRVLTGKKAKDLTERNSNILLNAEYKNFPCRTESRIFTSCRNGHWPQISSRSSWWLPTFRRHLLPMISCIWMGNCWRNFL